MEGLNPGPLAEALERRRERFNARFALAARGGRGPDPAAFAAHLAGAVDPIVRAVAACAPERVDAAAEALFDLSLELLAKDVLGPAARHPAVTAVWRNVLPALGALVAREPLRVAASLTNAATNVSAEPGARPEEWLDAVRRVGPACDTVPRLLEVGQVAAWRAGMAHFRTGAADVLRRLPPDLAAGVLGVRAEAFDREGMIAALADPWCDPAAPRPASPALAVVARVGGFRGFGGPFLTPPDVFRAEEGIHAADAESCWCLHADVFGAVFRRVPRPAPLAPPPEAPRVDDDGRVKWGALSARFPALAGRRTLAWDGTTLAVTVERSHCIVLVARLGSRVA